jgi:hypothetical protein
MKQLFNKVEEALQGIKRYHLRMEMDDELGYVSDSEFDIENKAKHSIIQIGHESIREVEFYWIGDKAYGLPRHAGTWFQVSVPGEPINHLYALSASLKAGTTISVQEDSLADERCWILSVTPDLSPLRSNAEKYTNDLFPQLREGTEEEQILAAVEKAMIEAEMQTEFWISQQTHYIKKAIFKTHVFGAETWTTYYISNINDPKMDISPPAEALEAEGPPIPFGALFIKLSRLGGWCEYNHCTMTVEALKLIQEADKKDSKYSEIYKFPGTDIKPPYYSVTDPKQNAEPSKYDHPTVQGAYAEDAGKTKRTNFTTDSNALSVKKYRYYRHFGGEDKGLKWEWYFKLHTDQKPIGGRYVSARDWGKGDGAAHKQAGESGDKMNFQGAIDAYNHYTDKGKKEAYYRMGHVLHLLQDVAQPDHANLVAHPASTKNEPDAYYKFKLCEILEAEVLALQCLPCKFDPFCWLACIPAGVIAAGVAYAACLKSIDPTVVGFEWLINNDWDIDKRIDKQKQLKIKKEASYDDYFKKMANESIAAAKAKGLKYPLGLESFLAVAYQIPGIDPDIKRGSKAANAFLELADEVIPKAMNRSAGLLQHFYEIVNFPPYVKAVTVARGVPGLSAEDVLLKPQNFIYSAKWKDELVSSNFGPKTKISSRKLVITKGEPISKTELGQRIYVIAEVSKEMKKLNLELKNCIDDLIDKEAMSDVTVPISTSLYGLYEKDTYYYFASFAVPLIYAGLSSNVCNAVVLEFTGEDDKPHFSNSKRNYSGKKLDSEPGTLAVAGNLSPYDWIGYEPGTDKNHKIRVISPDKHEPNNDLAHATPIKYTKNMQELLTGGETYYDLTLHDSSDIDFFSLQLPPKTKADIKCVTAKIPSNVEKIPGSLTIRAISVESEGSPIITIYKKDNNPYTFPTTSQIEKKPGDAWVTLYEKDLDADFSDGKVRFSIADESKKKICYEMSIQHNWCIFRMFQPKLLYWNPEWDMLGPLGGRPKQWLPHKPFPPGPFPPGPGLFPYPASPGNIDHVSKGELPEPEYFILRRSLRGKLQIDLEIHMSTPTGDLDFTLLDSSGDVLAKAEESSQPLRQSFEARAMRRYETYLRQIEYSRRKQITIDSLEAGIYFFEVSGRDVPAFYSLQFASPTEALAVIANCAEGLGLFDQECKDKEGGRYPVIDTQVLYEGKQTCKAIDMCGIQAHAGYYMIGYGGKEFEFDIDEYPILYLTMKAEKDTDTCLLLVLHDKEPKGYMRGSIAVGKTPSGNCGCTLAKDYFTIKDDNEWHDYTYDLRKLRGDYPDAKTARMVQFYSGKLCNGIQHVFHFSSLVFKK